ncbi:MAG: GAF domain-containing protein [Flavobacteriales bacterium]|nr:GAF domain-containing protein [Flavobacteriales bacterium]HRH70639.1 GAF domain-containing protein [Flavobacteriales bacterium]
MQDPITLPRTKDRVALFTALMPQVRELLHEEHDPVAAMANVTAALRQTFDWHWIGFYRVMGAELVLGPFQGPVACTRIGFGKGVCGTAWKEERTLIVPDVEAFPGHIACSPLSRSEIVVPIRDSDGRIAAVLDIDSIHADDFSTVDGHALELLCELLQPLF